MSTIYVSEPPTKGKLVLNTTHGALDIELWPKEAPKAVRNFVQLCLEGYYDNTIFHRILKGFLIQGGDPTGTGTGGQSVYGGAFADEFHQRLKFKYRGLVACANAGSPHSNGSQFFISLDRCDWLDRKNTIFGKVTGDSVYNLPRIADVETDKNERPLDPAPKIISVEVIWNPFDDIVPRVAPAEPSSISTIDTDNTKKKAVKKLNLLSFGEEAEEEEKELAATKQKIKSSHDVLNDPRLLKEEILSKELNSAEAKFTRDMQLSVRETLNSRNQESRKDSLAGISDSIDYSDDDEANFDARMRQQILVKRKELGDLPTKKKLHSESSSSKDHQMSATRSNAERSDDQPKKEKLYMKKKGIGSEAKAERMANADTDLQLLGVAERERQLKKQKKRRLQGREDDVLAKLEKFKESFSAKSDGNDDDISDWRGVRLKFAPEFGKGDSMNRSNDPNDYAVHDPLLEKGKEKFNKMQAKHKRRQREWAGNSLT